MRQKVKARLRQLSAAFAFQTHDKFGMQAVQIAHIAGGIIFLRFGQYGTAPVAGLLLLGNVCRQHFLHQFLQPVAVRVGPNKARGDFGAE